MNRSALIRLAFAVGVLVVMTLALAGCGGPSQEKAGARPLPKEPKGLQPGEYRSEKFEPPVSFRVGKGWSFGEEASDFLLLDRSSSDGGFSFTRIEKVYKPVPEADKTSMPTLVKPPEDLVGWFQDHPYLKVEGLEPITVGGIKGQHSSTSSPTCRRTATACAGRTAWMASRSPTAICCLATRERGCTPSSWT